MDVLLKVNPMSGEVVVGDADGVREVRSAHMISKDLRWNAEAASILLRRLPATEIANIREHMSYANPPTCPREEIKLGG